MRLTVGELRKVISEASADNEEQEITLSGKEIVELLAPIVKEQLGVADKYAALSYSFRDSIGGGIELIIKVNPLNNVVPMRKK